MKILSADQLRALLQEEIAASAINAAGTNRDESVFVIGGAGGSASASATANVMAVVNMIVDLVIKWKFTHDDIEEITGIFTRFGHVLSVQLDDERFPDAVVVRLEACVDDIVSAIQTLNLTKLGKSDPFSYIRTIYSCITPPPYWGRWGFLFWVFIKLINQNRSI